MWVVEVIVISAVGILEILTPSIACSSVFGVQDIEYGGVQINSLDAKSRECISSLDVVDKGRFDTAFQSATVIQVDSGDVFAQKAEGKTFCWLVCEIVR